MSSIKEPHYFSAMPKDHRLRPIKDKRKYLNLFKDVTDEKIIGEASPSYLGDSEAPKLIHELVPHAHILISLRDPVERVFSSYLMKNREGGLHRSFNDELQKAMDNKIDHTKPHLRLESDMYSENVKRYFDIFGREQVKVIIFEEFIKDAKGTVEEILRFLGLNQKLDNFEAEVHNPFAVARGSVSQFIFRDSRIRGMAEKILSPQQRKILREKLLTKKQPKPKINQEDKKILAKFYYDDVQKLKQLLERELPWPNFKN